MDRPLLFSGSSSISMSIVSAFATMRHARRRAKMNKELNHETRIQFRSGEENEIVGVKQSDKEAGRRTIQYKADICNDRLIRLSATMIT